jgi:hypothetical protein
MIDRTPPGQPDAAGTRGSHGQGDFVRSAQRDRLRKDQHYGSKTRGDGEVPDPYGEGGCAAGGDGQSGYGADFGQLQAAQRHERQVSEQDLEKAGTASKSNR